MPWRLTTSAAPLGNGAAAATPLGEGAAAAAPLGEEAATGDEGAPGVVDAGMLSGANHGGMRGARRW